MALTADYVNFIVYRYLQESGFVHSAYTLRHEVDMRNVDVEHDDIDVGCLLKLLQRGVQYLELEANAATGGGADDRFEALSAQDVLRAKGADELKALVRERRDSEGHTSSRSKPSAATAPRRAENSGAVLRTEGQCFTARWNPAGDMLACYGQGAAARLWHVGATGSSTGAAATEATARGAGATALAEDGATSHLSSPAVWRPDGAQVATGHTDGSIRLWHHTGQLEHHLEGHSDAILELAYSPDGSKLLSGAGDTTVACWDPHSGARLATAATHADAVTDVAWRDSTTFACSSYDGEVHILRLLRDDHNATNSHENHDSGGAVDMYVDAATGAERAANGKEETSWCVERVRTLAGHGEEVAQVVWAPNGWLLATCADKHAKLWSMHQGGSLCDLAADTSASAHGDTVLALAFRPAGPGSRNPALPLQLATAGDDCLVRLWDCEHGGLVHNLAHHKLPPRACAWSPDGRTLATGSFDCTVVLWDVCEGRPAREYATGGGVFDVCWNADGRRLAVSTKAGRVFVLDTQA